MDESDDSSYAPSASDASESLGSVVSDGEDESSASGSSCSCSDSSSDSGSFLVDDSDSDEDDDEYEGEDDDDEIEVRLPSRRQRRRSKECICGEDDDETLSSTDTYSDDDDDDDDDDSEEESEEDESEAEGSGKRRKHRKRNRSSGIDIIVGSVLNDMAAASAERKRKRRLAKESPLVQEFVKLQELDDTPMADDDADIEYFKTLPAEQQTQLMEVLRKHKDSTKGDAARSLKYRILEKPVPADVLRLALGRFTALANMDPASGEYHKVAHWIDGYMKLPIGNYIQLPVTFEDGVDKAAAFLQRVRSDMNEAIYGQDDAKMQILQFVAQWISNPTSCGNVVAIHGPMGIGKTTLIKNGVAKALGRPFHFITLGGATDGSFLDGHGYTYEGSTWGRIADAIMTSGCMNPVIYFDELDKVSETPRGEEIMNLLTHLTDLAQNDRFTDKYFAGIPLDLSRCLFIFSYNNAARINPILLDRMYNVALNGFDTRQKQMIADKYLWPAILSDVKMEEQLHLSPDVVSYIIEHYTRRAGETNVESGVRELKRCLQTIASRCNMLRFLNTKDLPFFIPEFQLPFQIGKAEVDVLLKGHARPTATHLAMYS
jgi:ATP-dependent Lon protease